MVCALNGDGAHIIDVLFRRYLLAAGRSRGDGTGSGNGAGMMAMLYILSEMA